MIRQIFPSPSIVEQRGSNRYKSPAADAPIAFLDRDGVVNESRCDHVKNWDEFVFLPGALDGLILLSHSGWRIVIVTNQAIVNRGRITLAELENLHCEMARSIFQHGGELSAVFACPHRPDEGCECRKPKPGLLLAAADHLAGALNDAILVGDNLTDLEAARRAGCWSILVSSYWHRSVVAGVLPKNCLAVVPDLRAAARHMVDFGHLRQLPHLTKANSDPC
jgi:D-glycero-D-manno-heptose 1,7-bisphosphate phosphatase